MILNLRTTNGYAGFARDPPGCSIPLAAGGVHGGWVCGASIEFGYGVLERPLNSRARRTRGLRLLGCMG